MTPSIGDQRIRLLAPSGILLALAAAALPMFVWLTSATVRFVDWADGAPERMALVPGVRPLVWATLGAVGVIALIIGAGWRRRSRGASPLWPLALLWLPILPFIPWIPDRFPLLLVFQGPLRWVALGAALFGWVAVEWTRGVSIQRMPRPGPPTLFAISLLVYIASGSFVTRTVGIGGDEPHYLVITESLLKDGDLQIENNHAQGDYRTFFQGTLRPDYQRRGVNGTIYSIHPPGLPALLVPAYAIGGYRGAMVFMCLLAALAGLLVFKAADEIAGRAAAYFTWLAYSFSVPVGVMSWMVYPEVPAAVLTAAFALWLIKESPEGAGPWLLRGTWLASFPWLHTKFLPLVAAILLCLVAKIWRRPANALALLAPILISVALWLYAYFLMYGIVDPFAPYGSLDLARLSNENVPRGVLGLLLDQEFGLLIYSPVYLVAGVGLWSMIRRPELRWPALALGGTAGVFVVAVTRSYMWWGGSSAPARFLVPVLPLVAPILAAAVRDLGRVARPLAVAALLMTLVTFGYLVANPSLRMIVQNRNGVGAMLEQVQAGAPLVLTLPSFIAENWLAEIPLVLPWIAALLLGWLAARGAARGSVEPSPAASFRIGAVGAVVALLIGCLLGSFAVPVQAHAAIANDGRLSLMDEYDPPRLSAFDYRRLRIVDDDTLFRRVTVEIARDEYADRESLAIAGPVWLPAGRYEATTRFRTSRPFEGSLVILDGSGPRPQFAELSGPLSNPARLAFELPITVPRVHVEATRPELAQQAEKTDIRPVSLVARSARLDVRGVRSVQPLASRPGAYIFFLDDNAYPEGEFSWTRGGRQTELLVTSSGVSALRFRLQNGASGGSVHLSVAGSGRDFSLAPWETRTIEMPVPPAARWVRVTISSEGAFRPSDVESGSRDTRLLGCRFSVALITS